MREFRLFLHISNLCPSTSKPTVVDYCGSICVCEEQSSCLITQERNVFVIRPARSLKFLFLLYVLHQLEKHSLVVSHVQLCESPGSLQFMREMLSNKCLPMMSFEGSSMAKLCTNTSIGDHSQIVYKHF